MRRLFLSLGALLLATPSLAALADEPAIRETIRAYVDAFNSRDVETMRATWTENAEHLDEDTGERTEGREAIGNDLRAAFGSRPEAKLAGQVESVRMTTPEVAVVTGRSTVEEPGAAPETSLFKAVLVLQEGKWRIDSIAERAAATPSQASALDDLSWLVGTWVDETEDVRIVTTFRWTDDGAFMLRSFDCVIGDEIARRGTQVIGWDPRAEHIRSWTFESDGGFGDATWSKNGDEWIIRSTQTLDDGRSASGTFVLARVDDDTATLRLIGHEIEGEPVPAQEAITMRRVSTEQAAVEEISPEAAPAADPTQVPGTSAAPAAAPAPVSPAPRPAPSNATPPAAPAATPVPPAAPRPPAPRATTPAPRNEGTQR